MIFNDSIYNKNWEIYSLSELGDFARGKSKHRPRNDINLFKNGSIPFIQTGEIKDSNLFILKNNEYYNEFGLKQSKLWDRNTLCITIAANIAETALLNYPACFPDSVVGFKANDLTSETFMYYIFKYIKNEIQKRSSGSTQDNINIEYLQTLKFRIPQKNYQNKILSILLNLDKKINLNVEINKNLESLAKTLYNYWFLQFEFPNEEGKPYKSSGSKMVYNELLKKEIPEDWDIKCFGDILTKQNRSFEYNKNVETLDLSVMPSNSFSLNDLNESNKFNTNLFTMKKYDLLFGSIRPYLKKAGIAPCDGAVAGTVHCYTVNKESNYNFALITLCSNNMFNYAINNSKGTKMPIVASDDLLKFLIPYNKSIVELFNKINIKEIISNNIMQNQELTKLRDFLLPLLMNGQVTIQDAEQQVNNTISNVWNAEKLLRFAQWKQMQGYAARGEVDEDTLMKIFDAMDKDAKK